VDAGGVTETDLAAQYRRASEVHLSRFQDDRFMQRQRPVLVSFSEEDAKEHRVSGRSMFNPGYMQRAKPPAGK
jgi:hypothetical protein